MEKTLDFNKSIYELFCSYPEVKEIMQELGFHDITKPGMLCTAGRFMTIPKGASMKGIALGKITEAFVQKGFTVNDEGGPNE